MERKLTLMDTIGTGSIEELVMRMNPKGYITFTNQELIDFIKEVKKNDETEKQERNSKIQG